jgi:hypothetical protein
MKMSQPDDFGLDLATRIAVHEMLLQKLFIEAMQNRNDPDAALDTMLGSLLASFEVDTLNGGHRPQSEAEANFVLKQSEYGKELSAKFVNKIRTAIGR